MQARRTRVKGSLRYNRRPMASRHARQNAILELVRQNRIQSQEQLAEALERQGFEVSQSTLSRDIRALGLIKVGNAWTVRQGAPRHGTEETLRLVLREFLVDTDGVDQFLVIRTARGTAATLADALDEARWPGVVGTLAGENTIFVLCRSAVVVADLRERIRTLTR
jgi:transcriptional regulator of arginine metabolism